MRKKERRKKKESFLFHGLPTSTTQPNGAHRTGAAVRLRAANEFETGVTDFDVSVTMQLKTRKSDGRMDDTDTNTDTDSMMVRG